MKKIYLMLTIAVAGSLSLFSQTMEVELTPLIDNTMFRDSPVSNGLGEFIFTGTTNKDVKKRALVKFDLNGAVPEGVNVDSALLILKTIKVKPPSTMVEVHRLNTAWGEGTSKAQDGDGKGAPATEGDATWSFAKFISAPWIKKGGDFAVVASNSAPVSAGNDVVFKSDRLTLDVNLWLQDTTTNNGWILIGDESKTATSVKFASKDHPENSLWPTLKLYYKGTSSVSELKGSESVLTVYQGTDINNIHIRNTGDPISGAIAIFSIAGTRIYSNELELLQGENTVEPGIQEPGIYVYQITSDGLQTSGKLMILKR